MLWKMLHRVERFPASFPFLVFLGTAERFSVCLKPSFFPRCTRGRAMAGGDALPIPRRAAGALAPVLAPETRAKPCLPPKEIRNGAESELSALEDQSDLAW